MSTSETFETNVAPCPCGAGHVVKSVDSPDNPWSRPSVDYYLSCTSCREEWVVSSYGRSLTHRATQAESSKADATRRSAEKEAREYLQSLLRPYLGPMKFRTKKDEHDFLVANGLYHGPVGRYRYERRDADMAQIATIGLNTPVSSSLVKSFGDEGLYAGLTEAIAIARQRATEKSKAVLRIRFADA